MLNNFSIVLGWPTQIKQFNRIRLIQGRYWHALPSYTQRSSIPKFLFIGFYLRRKSSSKWFISSSVLVDVIQCYRTVIDTIGPLRAVIFRLILNKNIFSWNKGLSNFCWYCLEFCQRIQRIKNKIYWNPYFHWSWLKFKLIQWAPA